MSQRHLSSEENVAAQAFINNLKELKLCNKILKRLDKDSPEILDAKRETVKDRVEKLRAKMLRAQNDFNHICAARSVFFRVSLLLAES